MTNETTKNISEENITAEQATTDVVPDTQAAEVEDFDDLGELASLMTDAKEREALIYSLLFSNGDPLTIERLCEVTSFEESVVSAALNSLQESLNEQNAGVELLVIGGAYQLRTRTKFAPFIRGLKASSPKRLSQPALETLAIVAYRQPIVKSDIERIRGVDATPTIKTLIDRRLIKIIGHQSTPGQPALYGTTDEFLKLFGLTSLGGLPTLRDIKELEAEPSEEQSEAASETTPA